MSGTRPRHVLTIADLDREEIEAVVAYAAELKARPSCGTGLLAGKTVMACFEKPSLRTRVSQEVGTAQLGGHCVYYDFSSGPLGTGKESPEDTMAVLTRMVDIFTARVHTRSQLLALVPTATIPIVNALDDNAHPLQMLADAFTISEFKGALRRPLRFCYCGDLVNNVTYDLMRLGGIFGWTVSVAGPQPPPDHIRDELAPIFKASGGSWRHVTDPKEAAKDADVIYTDSWMSYGIDKKLQEERVALFTPFKVTKEVLACAKPDCIFMNCLPADRKAEQTAEVIDDPAHSVVFQEAENRLHSAKALFVWLLGLGPFQGVHGQPVQVPVGPGVAAPQTAAPQAGKATEPVAPVPVAASAAPLPAPAAPAVPGAPPVQGSAQGAHPTGAAPTSAGATSTGWPGVQPLGTPPAAGVPMEWAANPFSTAGIAQPSFPPAAPAAQFGLGAGQHVGMGAGQHVGMGAGQLGGMHFGLGVRPYGGFGHPTG